MNEAESAVWAEAREWVWCVHCERCYKVVDLRFEGGFWLCHYEDCDADGVFDAWPWLDYRYGQVDCRFDLAVEVEIPEVPERNRIYPTGCPSSLSFPA